ncbi:Holliday junction resolvase RuvX [soil metagenome]
MLAAFDFGLKKVGVAIADSSLAEPISVLRYETEEELFKKIKEFLEKEKPEKIVVGISEGEMGEKSKEFGDKLFEVFGIPVRFQDETLSTMDANNMTIESHMKRKKRKEMIDAMAAAVMLQSYIDIDL